MTRQQIDALLYAIVAQEGEWAGVRGAEWSRELAGRERALRNADAALRAALDGR